MSRARAKGTAWESEVVRFLREWWPAAERRALAGAKDLGDITGIPGVTFECKNVRTAAYPEWVRQAEAERDNAGDQVGVVFAHVNGKAKADDGLVVMSPRQFVWLLREAGWGDE